MSQEKKIGNMLHIVCGDISNKEELKKNQIDTIVNAANPTLMGSDVGVDYAIHKAIDHFNKKIRKELGESKDSPDKMIRCQRGKAVLTKGYGLCPYVIHVVGAKFDVPKAKDKTWDYMRCSSSNVQIVESCYYEIVEILKENPEIKNVAIPVISSGAYGFPFWYALKIAIASVGNALAEWCEQDREMFEMLETPDIYFYLYGKTESELKKAEKMLDEYKAIFNKERKVVYQHSLLTNTQVILEIYRNDSQRGYFLVAKYFRLFLAVFRMLFLPLTIVKDIRGGKDWEKRRGVIERLTVYKILFPLLIYCVLRYADFGVSPRLLVAMEWFIIYCLLDTVTYLLTLIILADVQRPSANIIRSIILLFGNYLEASLDMAVLYFIHYRENAVLFRDAIAFGLLGESVQELKSMEFIYYLFAGANVGLKFFFVTLVFGYFASHMKQRKFRS